MINTMEHTPSSGSPASIQLSIVVPMYNEQANIGALFDRLLAVCRALPLTWEFVCVDDGSRDHTTKLVRIAQEVGSDQMKSPAYRQKSGAKK